jgi:flagellar motor switch protein FliN/FliY
MPDEKNAVKDEPKDAPPAPVDAASPAGSAPAGPPAAAAPAEAMPVAFPDLSADAPASPSGSIDLLMDVDLEVKIELGRTHMTIDDILRLKKGAVVELDKLAGDPVDILVNERLVARGEILVVNDNFCVRVTEIVDPEAGLRMDEKNA